MYSSMHASVRKSLNWQKAIEGGNVHPIAGWEMPSFPYGSVLVPTYTRLIRFTHTSAQKPSSWALSAADLNLEWEMNVFMQQMLGHRIISHQIASIHSSNQTVTLNPFKRNHITYRSPCSYVSIHLERERRTSLPDVFHCVFRRESCLLCTASKPWNGNVSNT